MRRGRFVLALVAATLLLPRAARAYDLDVETSAFVGAHFYSDAVRLGRTSVDASNALQHSGLFGIRVAFLLHRRVALEAELGLVPTATRDGAASVLAIGYRAQLRVDLLTGRFRPFLVAGAGAQTSSSSNSDVLKQDTNTAVHFGAGLAVDMGCHWGLRLDGRVQFEPATQGSVYFTEDGEIMLAMYGRFGKGVDRRCAAAKGAPATGSDGDHDGVPDAEDRCPSAQGPRENHGCPDRDSDGDGVVDRLDRCPDKAGPKDRAGCPDADGDGDGVVDRLDRCPDKSGPADNGGCPDPDGDGDGVVDRLDRCPDKSGPADNAGCPWPDSDGDGIVDKDDKCPKEPETKNGFQDEDGCPDEWPAAVRKLAGRIEGIVFAPTGAELQPAASPVLDRIAALLREYPALRYEINVHTDDTGKREASLLLSQARADAIMKYLVDHGIPPTRLAAKGFGPDRPISTNKTPTGKAQNRRVELRRLP